MNTSAGMCQHPAPPQEADRNGASATGVLAMTLFMTGTVGRRAAAGPGAVWARAASRSRGTAELGGDEFRRRVDACHDEGLFSGRDRGGARHGSARLTAGGEGPG